MKREIGAQRACGVICRYGRGAPGAKFSTPCNAAGQRPTVSPPRRPSPRGAARRSRPARALEARARGLADDRLAHAEMAVCSSTTPSPFASSSAQAAWIRARPRSNASRKSASSAGVPGK
jgi:hypothetical protein